MFKLEKKESKAGFTPTPNLRKVNLVWGFTPTPTLRKAKLVWGFTLIEAVLYLAIAGTVLYFISGFSFNAIFGKAKIETVHEVNQNSQSILNDIANAVSDAVDLEGIQ